MMLKRRYQVSFTLLLLSVNDVNAMDLIPYEKGSYYIFDRGYNDFERLYRIQKTRSLILFLEQGITSNSTGCTPIKWIKKQV